MGMNAAKYKEARAYPALITSIENPAVLLLKAIQCYVLALGFITRFYCTVQTGRA